MDLQLKEGNGAVVDNQIVVKEDHCSSVLSFFGFSKSYLFTRGRFSFGNFDCAILKFCGKNVLLSVLFLPPHKRKVTSDKKTRRRT